MAIEIERKFLVTTASYKDVAERKLSIIQAYLSLKAEATVRVRIVNDEAKLTIKSKNVGAIRNEWEYNIPVSDAFDLINRCAQSTIIDKTRYIIGPWEVDEFHGSLQGLVVAEIELEDENQQIEFPPFIGKEVTNDSRYYNSALSLATAPPKD